MSRRRVVLGILAVAVAVIAVVVVGVVWPGLDAQRTPPASSSVWALQTGDGRRYARVNTAIGELDTVRQVSNPSAVEQTADGAYLFTESFGKLTRIDDALPADLDDDALRQSPSTPDGTVDAAVAGDFVAYLTDTGAVLMGTLSSTQRTQLDPYRKGDDDTPEYSADAVAVDESGTVYAWSQADGAVTRFRIPTGEVAGRDAVANGPTSPVQLTAAGGVWFLVDKASGNVWRRGSDAAESLALQGDAVVSMPTSTGDAAYVADGAGLFELPVDGSDPSRIYGGPGRDLGAPARPTAVDGVVHAAWLGPAAGVLWRSDSGDETPLDYGGTPLGEDRRPVFTASGSTVILNEIRSGWVWSVPDGTLLPSSQKWQLDDEVNPQSEPSDQQAAVVIDPKPPVAEPDAFGVRAGSLAALPVLLNDHDPNQDVLSILPDSVSGLDPGFGTVSITDNGQRFAVQIAPGASGSASFTYQVTDGTAADGLNSPAADVTLTVVPDGANSAPQWCATAGCLTTWPEPEVAPGGTVTVPVLNGWVDPDGDPVMLMSAVDETGSGAVATTPAGDIVYQHAQSSVTEPQVVTLQVTVSDTRGAQTVKALAIRVSPEPKLAAESFTVVDTLGSAITVDVGPHVTGTLDHLALKSVRVLDDASAQAVVTAGSTTFDFGAQRPGTYRVAYAVTDGTSEQDATARITVLPDDAAAQLATAPVIAFVHPKEDVTVDVFTAVANPTHRVLLLSDVRPSPADGASMSVDVVGQNFLRVSGTTSDGAAGLLGTIRYTVSDGTDDAGARIEGEATVYLLPSAPDLAPIAVDDSVVVRAGAQVDIPVLDNDVAIAGGTITLDPSSVTSDSTSALAFASGRTLRYLAPADPGDYYIDYRVFSSGSPLLADDARVHVDVISDDANRAPRPETLEGRVLSGEATTIPFRSFGVDPDGDDVALDRILAQPASGSATLSADGASIVYTSVPGFHGQVSFTYQVADASGATGTGSVRVGVLDEKANPSPVTFTDYVQLQVGETNSVRVSPVANDIDPTGGSMSVTDVRPDLVETLADGSANPEYARQKKLLGTRSDTQVVIRAGEDPGTMSFLYDVESSSGNTARGLIVVKVVREAVPDFPVVTDTALTAETRDRFPDGVDVVAGKVAWSGGDVSDLTLSLWGDPDGVQVQGTTLRGPVPARTRIIPFALSGTNAAGEQVTSYGFLRVPGDDDVTLALRAGLSPREVKEGESVTWDMADLVSVPRGASIEVGDAVATSGARGGAACTRESGSTIRYDAAQGAPWADACIVPVRLAGRDDYTYLSVPVRVIALEPQPELKAASVTVGPGQTATYDLREMTTWQGRTDWDAIAYGLDYSGADFTVTLDGSIVTITGADRALPGAEEAAVITVTSHADVAPSRLVLRVGAAPNDLPRGGTLASGCSQASGSSCTFDVVGATGEVNPLPRTPLEVVDVRPTGACVGIAFSVASASAVTASWAADAPGSTCTASFTVRDAQGRISNGDRDGQILLDLQGYPQTPAAISQAAYGDGTVTLRVDPGDSRQAYPALGGFLVRYQGQVVATCSPDGACPLISAPNGEERVYQATAFNDVGESRGQVATTAWAYDAPPPPESVTAAPVVTSGDGGYISMQIDGLDTAETAYVEITSPAGEVLQVRVGPGDASLTVPRYRVGSNTASPVTVTPYSRFAVPPGLAGTTSGASRTINANGIGAPTGPVLALDSTSNGDATATVTAAATAALNGDGSSLVFGVVRDGQRCVVSADGANASFVVDDGIEYSYRMCAESVYQGTTYGRVEATATVRAVQSTAAPQGWTFVVDPTPAVSSGSAQWTITQQPTSAETPPRNNVAEFQNWPGTTVFDRDPGILVRYVHQDWGPTTDWAAVTPAGGSAPYQTQARWSATCDGGADLAPTSSSSNDLAAISFDRSKLTYVDASGAVLPHDDSWLVPVGAVRADGIGVTVDWSAQGWGLNPATDTFSVTCTPNLPVPGP